MNNERVNGLSTAATVILAILLAIILRASLEAFFIPLTTGRTLRQLFGVGSPPTETWLRTWQFVVFLVLLARFYGGAYRFIQEQPAAATVPDTIVSLIGTFGLFCLFYITAINVWTLDLFYVLVFAMHLFDFVWFLIVLLRLQPRSLLQHPVKLFILWDVLTVVAYIGSFAMFWRGFLDASNFSFQWAGLSVLVVITVIDWWWLGQFYFRPDKWREEQRTKAEPKATA